MSTDLHTTLSGSDTGLTRALQQAERATTRAENAMSQYQRSTEDTWSSIAALEQQMERENQAIMDRRMNAYDQVGKSALIMGAVISAGIALATNAAMGWETAWTGVLKTVDGTEEEMAQLEGQLRQLAKTLPFTHQEIAAVAEAAGQLGIKRESVAGFTKTMLDMGVSTNLTAEQAATDFARLATIMQMPTDKMSNLGSTAVALGNNFATTEAEIVSLGLRLAGAGKQVGLTEAQVFGLAASMSQVGIEAEAGGSAMSMTMAKIDKDLASGSDRVEQYAEISGMSAAQFAAAWRNDAGGALSAFVMGLGEVEQSGGNVGLVLDDLGIKSLRQVDTLNRLSGAGTLVADAMGMASEAFAENNALVEESNRFYGTSENRLKVAGNEAKDLAIDMGAELLPALVAIGEEFANVTAFVAQMPGPMKTTAMVAAVLAAGIALTGGAALVAVPRVVAFKAAVDALEAGALKTAGNKLIGLGSILAGPWGVGLAAAAIGVSLFAAKQGEASREVDALRATLDEQTGALTENSRQWVIKELTDSGALQAAQDLGLNLADVTDAVIGQGDAAERLAQHWSDVREEIEGQDNTKVQGDIATVERAIAGTSKTLEGSRKEWELQNEAMNGNSGAAGKAEAAQKGVTGAWGEGAEAADDLSGAADKLKESFDELSGGFLNEREASRQVRDSLRGIREAMSEYIDEHGSLKGAFKEGTESGDKFAGMLDGLGKDYQSKITASVEAGKSEEAVAKIYDRSRAKLMKVAEQMGMTEAAAEAYVDQVLNIPEIAETKAKFDDTDALQKALGLKGVLDDLARERLARVVVNYVGNPGAAPKGTDPRSTFQADGSVLDFNADGDIKNGHVAQIAPAGAWRVWAEDETMGEAYIPFNPAKRARSLDIWAETGKRLGVEGFANGGMTGVIGSFLSGNGPSLAAVKELSAAIKALTAAQRTETRAETRAKRADNRVSDARSDLSSARGDRASRLDILQQRSSVRDLRNSLTAKGEDRLSGLDREVAKAQLREAEIELKSLRASGRAVKAAKRELTKARREAKKEAAALKAAQQAVEAAEKAKEAADERAERGADVAGQGDLFAGGGVQSTSNRLDRLLRDVSDYNTVYKQLSAAGASAWLLGQMDGQAKSGDYRSAIRFGRQLLGDRNMFAKIEGQGARLGALGVTQGALVQAGPAPGAPARVAASLPSMVAAQQQTVVPAGPVSHTTVTQHIQTTDVTLVAREVLRQLAFEGVI